MKFGTTIVILALTMSVALCCNHCTHMTQKESNEAHPTNETINLAEKFSELRDLDTTEELVEGTMVGMMMM